MTLPSVRWVRIGAGPGGIGEADDLVQRLKTELGLHYVIVWIGLPLGVQRGAAPTPEAGVEDCAHPADRWAGGQLGRQSLSVGVERV